MNKLLILIAIASVTLFSCKKEGSAKVKYTEFQPALSVTSVDSLVSNGSGCGSVAMPFDTTATINIDINNDGTGDFTIKCTSWYSQVSASNPCGNYHKSIVITGNSGDNLIAVKNEYNVASTYDFDAEISSKHTWNNNAILMMQSAQAPFNANMTGDNYIGLKAKLGKTTHYAWLYINKTNYVVTVKSCGVNLKKNKSIRAGQQ